MGSKLSLLKDDRSGGQLEFMSKGSDVLYYYEGVRTEPTTVMTAATKQTEPTVGVNKMDINEAHDKFGHIGEAALKATLKTIGLGTTGVLRSCEGCAVAKAKTKSIPKVAANKAEKPGERLCTDIGGPYKKSIIGNSFWALVVDEYSRKSWSYFVSRKSELATKVTSLVTKLISAGHTTKYLRCDNAGENVKGLSAMCIKFNFQIEMTAPYMPQQNGMVEQKFVTIRDRSCVAMTKANFTEEYQGLLWAESVHTSTRLTNIVCNTRGDKCPDELFYRKMPDIYKHLVEFGRISFMKLGKKQNKLKPKAAKCVMIGYSANHASDTYRLYNTETKKVVNSCNVQWADWHGAKTPTDGMIGFDSDEPGIDEDEQARVPGPGNQEVISKTRGNNNCEGISKTSTCLSRELKKLEWNEVPKETMPAEDSKEQDKVEQIKDDTSMEVHNIYTTTLTLDLGEPKNFKAATQGTKNNE